MKIKTYIFLIALSTILMSCKSEKNFYIDIPEDHFFESGLPVKKVCDLEENLEVIGEIKSVSFSNKNSFVVSVPEPAGVILYNTEGEQLRLVGNSGNGPFEYIRPSLVRVYNDNIYVWCSMLTKLLVFDTSGNPVNEYSFSRGIRDFVVFDNYVYFYSAGGFDEPIINVFDLNTGQTLEKGFGEKTNEHKIFMFRECTGGLDLSENNLLFSPTHKPYVYRVNLMNLSKEEYLINDPEFSFKKTTSEPQDFIYDIVNNAEYLFGSDIITGIYHTENHVILQAEVGKIVMSGLEFKDISNRKQKFYVFDKEMKLQFAVSSPISDRLNNCLYASNDDSFYAIGLCEDYLNYRLYKVGLSY